jgi:hypothetical protein
METPTNGTLKSMRSSQGMRLIWVGLLALLLHIPIGMIGGLISERDARRGEAVAEVSSKWGGVQILSGPALVVRYAHRWTEVTSSGKQGVRPLKLHCARHTWATLALQAGRSVKWVAEQLGHAGPAFTLLVYAHAMREEEVDLSFVDFGGSVRPDTAPLKAEHFDDIPNCAESMARREGFIRKLRFLSPTLRFEA